MASKVAERIYLDGFLRSTGWDVESVAETERPDFIVTVNGRRLGVEIRRVFKDGGRRGSMSHRAERERARFLRRAAETYYALDGASINVKVLSRGAWHHGDPAAFATRLLKATPGHAWEESKIGASHSAADPEAFVTRLPLAAGRHVRWMVIGDSVGWVRSIRWTDIEGIVREKADCLEAYRGRANEVILVLVADRLTESGMLRYVDPAVTGGRHGFTAVYWYEHMGRTIHVA